MWVDASPSWAGVGCGLPRFCRSGPGDSRCTPSQLPLAIFQANTASLPFISISPLRRRGPV